MVETTMDFYHKENR